MIYEPGDRGKPELGKYVSELREIGSHVVKTVESGGIWKSLNGTKKSGEWSLVMSKIYLLKPLTSAFSNETYVSPIKFRNVLQPEGADAAYVSATISTDDDSPRRSRSHH